MQLRVMMMMTTMTMMMSDDGLSPLVLTSAAPVYTPAPGRGLETPTRRTDRRQQQTIDGNERPSNEELTAYLERFGYLPRRNHTKHQHSDKDIKSAIRHLQRFVRIKETGSWNNETADLFRRPRCGLPDEPSVEGDRGSGRRRRRYTLTGGKWSKNQLNYRIQSFSSKLKPGPLQSALQNAFNRWSDVIPLIFQQTFSWFESDIEIMFARLDHGDGFPFDGPGGTLSHTFSPTDGRMHFDEDETWCIDSPSPDCIDFRQVSLHEIGHVIGLGHSNYQGAVMNPYYPGYQPEVQLTLDDIRGAQDLYGAPSGYVPPDGNDDPSTTTTTSSSSSSSTATTTTTSIASSSSSSPVAAVMTPKLEPRLTPTGMPPKVTVLRVTPKRY